MQQSTNRVFDILFRALAYMLGGMFLVVTSGLIGQVVGGIFIAFAFLLVVVASVGTMPAWIGQVHQRFFSSGLLVATEARVIITAAQTGKTSYLVVAIVFGVLIIAALLFQGCRNIKAIRRKKSAPKP